MISLMCGAGGVGFDYIGLSDGRLALVETIYPLYSKV